MDKNIIESEDIEKFEYLININTADGKDKQMIKNLCNKYKLRGCNFCSNCPQQVRNVYNKVINFYKNNKDK